jgi:hypothetical protein
MRLNLNYNGMTMENNVEIVKALESLWFNEIHKSLPLY